MSLSALNVPASLITVGVLILLSNTCVLLALRKLRTIKKSTYFFIIQLTIADLFLGFLIILRSILFLSGHLGKSVCAAILSLSLGSLGISSNAITLLYFELFLAVKNMTMFRNPLGKYQTMTLQIFSVLIWLTLSAVGYNSQETNIQVWNYAQDKCEIRWAFNLQYIIAIDVLFVIFLVLTLSFQIGTLVLMRNRHKQMFQQQINTIQRQMRIIVDDTRSQVSTSNEDGEPGTSNNVPRVSVTSARLIFNSKETFKERWLRRKMNMTKLITIVLIIFVVCWYPSVCLSIAYAVMGGGDSISDVVFNYSWIAIPIHAAANLFIYAAKSKDFRRALRDAFCGNCPSCAVDNRVEPFLVHRGRTSSCNL
ncbi:hypothetical protein CAPTEDRAFT_212270 [Capitella teleta]|uniref:G-protein coupled receptors family 1 profile domain-containing protein n=1 Tax=Capitella teleta TaxID=283909 RepID=R7UB99_CAPTE|nr:hypothetical protein CAPTEDRAFT_212270 [Capitella teleta]|eukprot:ELU03264.1 hypothetical protein CAPTEDRAFT_212270 [Capitella teleta]